MWAQSLDMPIIHNQEATLGVVYEMGLRRKRNSEGIKSHGEPDQRRPGLTRS